MMGQRSFTPEMSERRYGRSAREDATAVLVTWRRQLLLWIITNGNSSVSDFVEIHESMLTKLRKIKSSLLFLNAFMI
jgi:hypothetical protein